VVVCQNSWLNHYLTLILPKLATAEHHLGTTEYILMAIAVVGGLVGIGIAYAKYIKQKQFRQKMLTQGF
jgi:NADH-quinone oxidoreductase subunit L